jgi:hypothetical protein
VYCPDWAPQVSQDVPFSDGISGWFDIEVEAMTPVFIRHGEKPAGWNEDNPSEVSRLREHWLNGDSSSNRWPEDDWLEFFKLPDGGFAIPGSSLKGALREILEIASFGKFQTTNGRRLLLKGNPKKGTWDIQQKTIQERSQISKLFESSWDLAETIFGHVSDISCRGRIFFESLRCANPPSTSCPLVWPVLQTPKGKFAPNYGEQPSAGGDTGWTPSIIPWKSGDARLRGWKLYPRRPTISPCPEPPPDKNGNIRWDLASPMKPLPAKTRFQGRVNIHNLRPFELGALLWILALGEAPDSAAKDRHYWLALGAAKPFGYGSIVIRVMGASLVSWQTNRIIDYTECKNGFVSRMNEFHKGGAWLESPQIRALQALSNPNNVWKMDLKYPTFKEFQDYTKDNNHALLPTVSYQFVPDGKKEEISPPKPPPPPLPNIIGQQHRVSFLRAGRNQKYGRELFFSLKLAPTGSKSIKYEGILRNPHSPALAGNLVPGHSVLLWVIGIESGSHYLLSETASESSTDP